jgi:RNA polymerase sigma-70 factor (ECF subfamily)
MRRNLVGQLCRPAMLEKDLEYDGAPRCTGVMQAGSSRSSMYHRKSHKRSFIAQALPELEHLYCLALYMLDNESEAQDLVQESLATAYQSWSKDPGVRDRRVGLFRIMVKALSNKYRPSPNQSFALRSTDEIVRFLPSSRLVNQRLLDHSVKIPLSGISQDEVKNAIRNLPDDFRLIVVLSLLEDFSYREIAEIACLNVETVRCRLYQGRKLMQRELCEYVTCSGNYGMSADRVRSRNTG